MTTSSAPNRPARGLPAEQALEHWSDPEAYAAMREYWAYRGSPFFVAPGPSDPRELKYTRRRRPLEEAMLERLRTGALMATAIPEDADPTASRMIVDPEVFSHGSLVFEMDTISKLSGKALSHVEIFKPPGVPRNVRIIPDWYWEQHESAAAPSPPDGDKPRNEPSFGQEADYRRVWINGAKFRLTDMQAKVVKLLHAAHLQGDPWQSGKKILGQAGSRSTRMFQAFRSHKTPILVASDRVGWPRPLPPEHTRLAEAVAALSRDFTSGSPLRHLLATAGTPATDWSRRAIFGSLRGEDNDIPGQSDAPADFRRQIRAEPWGRVPSA